MGPLCIIDLTLFFWKSIKIIHWILWKKYSILNWSGGNKPQLEYFLNCSSPRCVWKGGPSFTMVLTFKVLRFWTMRNGKDYSPATWAHNTGRHGQFPPHFKVFIWMFYICGLAVFFINTFIIMATLLCKHWLQTDYSTFRLQHKFWLRCRHRNATPSYTHINLVQRKSGYTPPRLYHC